MGFGFEFWVCCDGKVSNTVLDFRTNHQKSTPHRLSLSTVYVFYFGHRRIKTGEKTQRVFLEGERGKMESKEEVMMVEIEAQTETGAPMDEVISVELPAPPSWKKLVSLSL